MASRAGSDAPDHSHDGASGPGKRSSPLGELSLDRLRSLSADLTREALLGGLLAVGVALVQIVGFYILLLIRWAVGAGDAPGIGALVGFVAAHGGAIFVKVPPAPALLGIGEVGAAGHCEVGGQVLLHSKVFDWLDKTLVEASPEPR